MSPEDEALIESLGPREVIGQAVGLLIARYGVSKAAALEMLVQGAADSPKKVREIAASIVRQRPGA